jgi:hypothetical protein
VKVGRGEVLAAAVAEFKSRRDRDRVMKRVLADPRVKSMMTDLGLAASSRALTAGDQPDRGRQEDGLNEPAASVIRNELLLRCHAAIAITKSTTEEQSHRDEQRRRRHDDRCRRSAAVRVLR